MLESKREFGRFDLPLIVKFRPTYGATQYHLGLTKNISLGGLCLEARDFNFIKFENLEMEMKFPRGNSSISLFGNIMWKKRDGKISCAGIKFRFEEENIKNDLIEKISCNANIPLDALLKSKETKPVKTEEQSSELQRSGLLKQYLKDGKCEVTFRLPKEAAPDAGSVVIVGDFNAWDASAAPMTKLENGDFTASLKLNGKKEYRFKYLIDGHHWENDWSADKYVPNSFGSDDSVVVL